MTRMPNVQFFVLGLAMVVALGCAMKAKAGESADVLFPQAGVRTAEVSPTGLWIAASARYGDVHGVLVQRIGAAEIVSIIATEDSVERMEWVGPNTVFVRFGSRIGSRSVLVNLEYVANRVDFEIEKIFAPGALVDPLPLADGVVLWEFAQGGESSVHRIELKELLEYGEAKATRKPLKKMGTLLASFNGEVETWVVDRHGFVRGAQRRRKDAVSIWARDSGGIGFREIYQYLDGYDDTEKIRLLGMTSGEDHFVVAAYHGQDTLGLYEMNPKSGELEDSLFVREDLDVTGVLVDFISHELVAAAYESDGETRYHYFDSYRNRFLDDLGDEFPRESVRVLSGTLDRRYYVIYFAGPKNPGSYYLRDSRSRSTIKIAESGSDIDRDGLADVKSFKVHSEDGLEIEAFLALPRVAGGTPAPLIVMPHGGPIDVRDNKTYDPLVQYLASWGFAVLQPNYRGSRGYGLDFIESGKKQWAKGIENDIDAAVEYAMSLPEIDGNRICIVGGSYGGFSAIANVIRHKHRYKCSISLNGVSDIPLLYDSSDMADSKSVMDFYEEYVGDLETEREKLIEVSPAYQVNEIETPVYLIYGTEDRRVDPDHSHRMLLMLETLSKEHDSLEVRDMAHSPDRREWIIVARAMRRYLTRYLQPDSEFLRDPASGESKASSPLLYNVR